MPEWMYWNDTIIESKYCNLYGVYCDNTKALVQIDFSGAGGADTTRGLIGTIPSILGDILSLEALALDGNQFSGTIPSELFKLPKLVFLKLNGNKLHGTIPPFVDMQSLKWLDLSGNSLTGTIPSEFGKASNSSQISTINLLNNNIRGTIPSQLGTLASLANIDVSSNYLTGIIPSELANLNFLETLSLTYNYLTGSIPKELLARGRLRDPKTRIRPDYNCLVNTLWPQRPATECLNAIIEYI